MAMELNLIIGKKFIKDGDKCIIYSDSLMTINCATSKWKKKANLDLWDKYEKLSENKKVTFEWVKAHSDNYYNNQVDKLAREEAKLLLI